MADAPNGNGNGRRAWLTKDTFVPWGAAFACASLAWWASSKYGDLEKAIQANAASVAANVADQRRETSLDLQALRYEMQAQGERIGRIEKSVEALTRGGGK